MAGLLSPWVLHQLPFVVPGHKEDPREGKLQTKYAVDYFRSLASDPQG